MLDQICGYLKNWFEKDKYVGDITIEDNVITPYIPIQDGQYIRIVNSVFNDGIYKIPLEEGVNLTDETFHGGVWLLAIPKEVLDLATDIEAWQAKYGGVDSQAMSPFNSESFGGYSYSKSSGASADGSNSGTWQSAFSARLSRWRKI